ncbi:MAG: arsenosugar biosynthesis radical SAM protein ArsS [bacterium]|nr:arsenosugar biosynthesis radical SAM protein ArsS [bacterium]
MQGQNAFDVVQSFPSFEDRVPEEFRYTNDKLGTLQVNVGYKCNLACKHCHLECSPAREELMDRKTMQACIDAYKAGGFTSMDITGGAPEMNPDYEWFLNALSEAGIKPMCRTNLCILLDPQYAHFAELYAKIDATLVASLPYFSAANCDKIRGAGTFDACIEALRKLNSLGFGTGEHPLILVYNPSGAVLPPAQASMEGEYKEKLRSAFGVEFDSLIAIANNPSGRFAARLNDKNNLEKYMNRLIGAFNVATCEGMMCRDQVSVDYNGVVYDCDFNQALRLRTEGEPTIFDMVDKPLERRHIVFANHCYGCTAGAGSSCGGATA